MPDLSRARFALRRVLASAGVMPAALNAYRSLREWRPGMALRNVRLRRAMRSALPVPPSGLLFSVANSRDLDWFLRSGEAAAQAIAGAVAAVGRPLESFAAVLDFGCGCGRVLRHFAGLKGGRLYGCDYNPAGVAWVRQHLPFATAAVNGLRPPLAYGDGSFDLVYALSVFTHLPADLQRAWMAELTRVLRPGGLLVLTTMGEHFVSRLTPAEQKAFRDGGLVVRDARYAGSNVCAAYHPESYVRAELAAGFSVVAFQPRGALGNPGQDLYVLERPR